MSSIPCLYAFIMLAAVEAQAGKFQDFVNHLNQQYQAYDPDDDSSPAGVLITAWESSGEEPYLADCSNCGNLYGIPLPTGGCRVSASYLNAKNSHVQKGWAMRKTFESVFPLECEAFGTCNIELAIYPVGGEFAPWKREMLSLFTTGGTIFSSVAEQAMKCSYPYDGASFLRPNRGCGCTSFSTFVCPPNKDWHCPTTLNTCSNKDPVRWSRNITEDSSVLTACQCSTMGLETSDNPLWKGVLGLQYPPGLPKCVWQGPQFFEGKGRNELRQALKQQHNFKEHAHFAWNEIVLDGEAYNDLIDKKAVETITAFWYPKHKHCGRSCQTAVYKARDAFAKKTGVQVPVVIVDVRNGTAPFLLADQNAPAHEEEELEVWPTISV